MPQETEERQKAHHSFLSVRDLIETCERNNCKFNEIQLIGDAIEWEVWVYRTSPDGGNIFVNAKNKDLYEAMKQACTDVHIAYDNWQRELKARYAQHTTIIKSTKKASQLTLDDL